MWQQVWRKVPKASLLDDVMGSQRLLMKEKKFITPGRLLKPKWSVLSSYTQATLIGQLQKFWIWGGIWWELEGEEEDGNDAKPMHSYMKLPKDLVKIN